MLRRADVNRMADGEMVHHMALLGRQAVITVDLIVEERAEARRAARAPPVADRTASSLHDGQQD
jgi:hypothetical protein